MNNIIVVGAGQLGSRYLQGLAGIESPFNITVVDPSNQSLATAKLRFAEMEQSHHSISFQNSIAQSDNPIDLCIVVTPAHCRADVVATITAQHEVRAWILEKVLAQNTQQVAQIERALAGNSRVWVNTPRRLMAWHERIRKQLRSSGPAAMQVRIRGGSWGLACNAIHFIDLVCWWTGADVETVDSQGLTNWHSSKRPGFYEVFGTFTLSFSDGTLLELSCNQCDAQTHIEVDAKDGIWLIDEVAGKAIDPSGQIIPGQLSFQSMLTAPLVKQILSTGICDLPSLAESAAQHRPFLTALLQHWNHSQSLEDLAVPIT